MKIFISSLIGGFESHRAAARLAVATLQQEPVMAEDFGARPESPQIACLQGIRSADALVLILGGRYGTAQGSSGLSPTHEEYREARGAKPILAYMQTGVEREQRQEAFVKEVEEWEGGHFRSAFSTPDDLRNAITRDLHGHLMASAAGPVDVEQLRAAAEAMLPTRRGEFYGTPTLSLAMVGGPYQRLLRPIEVESAQLDEDLQRQALFGAPRLFSRERGVRSSIVNAARVVRQEGGGTVALDEHGSLTLSLPIERGGSSHNDYALMSVIEEDVFRVAGSAIAFCGWALDRIDPTRRVTQAAIAARIDSGGHLGWTTKAEMDAERGSRTIHLGDGQGRVAVLMERPRPALIFQAREMTEDLVALLRRQFRR